MGWRGFHVEPAPAYADAVREGRPDETVFEVAVTPEKGPILFYLIPSTGISTGISSIADEHRLVGWNPEKIDVETITLSSLFDKMGSAPIHWMKIDVEGMEGDVLKSW